MGNTAEIPAALGVAVAEPSVDGRRRCTEITEQSLRTTCSELLRRKQAKETLVDYVACCELGFTTAAHHQLLARQLEAVEHGEING
jgi:hypothetical protein